MKARIIALVVGMLVVSAGLRADDNPLIGRWKINLAKTKYNAGTPPKNQVITYEMVGDALKLTAEIDNAQGHQTNTYTAKYDGKDYPFNSTARDAVSGQMFRLKRMPFARVVAGKRDKLRQIAFVRGHRVRRRVAIQADVVEKVAELFHRSRSSSALVDVASLRSARFRILGGGSMMPNVMLVG